MEDHLRQMLHDMVTSASKAVSMFAHTLFLSPPLLSPFTPSPFIYPSFSNLTATFSSPLYSLISH